MISQLIFAIVLLAAIVMFTRAVKKISRNIKLGKPFTRTDRRGERWKAMLMVAIGQSKMVKRPFAGVLHVFVYAGFIIINIEVLEILIDGIAGTHRVFAPLLGPFYTLLITAFEFLAVAVALSCAIFLIRRNIGRLKRFWSKEMTAWPRTDANIILITEILLMTAFLFINACEKNLNFGVEGYYGYPVSNIIFNNVINFHWGWEFTKFVMNFCWWFHIVGILAFLNYIPYSKHFHIVLAFPNVYYSNLNPKGEFNNLESVTREVKLLLDPSSVPPDGNTAPPERFGAKDVFDLSGIQLMNAFSCTECGRCTSSCPANQTGKLLSPRKIMMDTRDRLEEVGKNMDKNGGKFADDGKSLLFNYISPEELWACTSCNACTEECPVNIDPLSIIVDLRRFLVMEQSAAPQALAQMMTNIENNGAPWQFPASDRMNWVNAL